MSDSKTKESVKQETRPQRRERIPVSGARDILTVMYKDPNYTYRWVKDLPGRIQRFLDAGYEIVIDEAIRVGQTAVDSGSRLGTAVTRLSGAATMVLMRIPNEWYNEDQEAKQREIDAMEEVLKGDGLKSVTRDDDSWQPNGSGYVGRKADPRR